MWKLQVGSRETQQDRGCTDRMKRSSSQVENVWIFHCETVVPDNPQESALPRYTVDIHSYGQFSD